MGRREVTFATALLAVACGGRDGTLIGPGTPSLDAVNGAVFPILVPGQGITLEGLGFGNEQGVGAVVFRSSGGDVAAPSDSTEWSNTHIVTVVPADVAAGEIEVLTDAGISLRRPFLVASPPAFEPAAMTWTPAAPLPTIKPGIAAAAGQHTIGTETETFVVAIAGGDAAGDTTRVFLGKVDAAGIVGTWQPVSSLPAPRIHAALVVATPHSSRRSASPALYVVGGLSPTGQALGTVIAASLTLPDGDVGEWVPVAALPEGLVAPRAVLASGMIYLTGGTDAAGAPRSRTYLARVRSDGALEGWFRGPDPAQALAFHGSASTRGRLWVFGGADDVVPPTSSDTLEPRRDDGASTALSSRSGYFTMEPWRDEGAVFLGGRSRFATLRAGEYVLAVGGLYPGAGLSLAETVAAVISDTSLGPFGGPVGANTIVGQGGGVPVDAVGVAWHDLSGRARGLILGGSDLATGGPSAKAWRY